MNKLKNKVFRVCPKSGRIVGVRKPQGLMRVFFPLIGVLALAWFLLRVVPKPSRAAYPCQTRRHAVGLRFRVVAGRHGWVDLGLSQRPAALPTVALDQRNACRLHRRRGAGLGHDEFAEAGRAPTRRTRPTRRSAWLKATSRGVWRGFTIRR